MCNVALACSSELVSESDDFSEVHNLKVNVKAEYVYRCFTVIVTHEVIQKNQS